MPKQDENKSEATSFEDAVTQLNEIVRDLEQGNLSLDESLQKYEVGIGFLNLCQKQLAQAERKIDVLSGFDADGNPVTQPIEDADLTLQEKADSRSRRRTAEKNPRPSGKSAHQRIDEAHANDEPTTPKTVQDDVDLGGTLF